MTSAATTAKSASVLALSPSSRGLAFVLFEGPLAPVDWGIKDIRGRQKSARSLEAAKRLIDGFHPDVLVLDDLAGPYSRRPERTRDLQQQVAEYAERRGVTVHRYDRLDIRACFEKVASAKGFGEPKGAMSREEIAQSIADMIPRLASHLPPVRRLWMPEDARLSLFDAAALGVTFYGREGWSLSG